jgi:hypothetical protein
MELRGVEMAQSPQKDNSHSDGERKTEPPPPQEDGLEEIVETVAAAYFAACRKMARLFNRKKR